MNKHDVDIEMPPLHVPDLEDELTDVLRAASIWRGHVIISVEEFIAAQLRFRATVNAAVEADRQRRGEPVKVNAIFETQDGEVIGTTDAKVKRVEWQDDGSLTVVIDYWPQPAEPLKSRRIDDALRGLQASVAVGSDGAWVSIRREARDAAVKLLQELNSDCAHLYEPYVEAVNKPAPQPAEPVKRDEPKCKTREYVDPLVKALNWQDQNKGDV